MFHPPAFCINHGIFPATAYSIAAGAMNNAFIGCRTYCPQCGKESEVLPGVYDAQHDGLNILVDPSISPEMWAALRDIAERLQQGTVSIQQAKAEAEKITPKA